MVYNILLYTLCCVHHFVLFIEDLLGVNVLYNKSNPWRPKGSPFKYNFIWYKEYVLIYVSPDDFYNLCMFKYEKHPPYQGIYFQVILSQSLLNLFVS